MKTYERLGEQATADGIDIVIEIGCGLEIHVLHGKTTDHMMLISGGKRVPSIQDMCALRDKLIDLFPLEDKSQ